jgi:hypothetical protein
MTFAVRPFQPEATLSLLKEKSTYRPTGLESALAWVFTLASCLVLAWIILRSFANF